MSELYMGRQWVSWQSSRQSGLDPRSAWHALQEGVAIPEGTKSRDIRQQMGFPACGHVGQASYYHALANDLSEMGTAHHGPA